LELEPLVAEGWAQAATARFPPPGLGPAPPNNSFADALFGNAPPPPLEDPQQPNQEDRQEPNQEDWQKQHREEEEELLEDGFDISKDDFSKNPFDPDEMQQGTAADTQPALHRVQVTPSAPVPPTTLQALRAHTTAAAAARRAAAAARNLAV
tara:strand:- start:852 stop:1307 length:456 start_codon:yes stop_codon:yes gene_type:complete